MSTCLFCKLVRRELPVSVVYEDERLLAFNDLKPEAPTHVLIIPKQHIENLNALSPADDQLVGAMFRVAADIARERGIAESGYRTVFNTNGDAGQSVFHLHLHLLGGRSLRWPPG